ncbi:hypothetical protein [Alkalihalobacillus sp. 1P02AB]
MKMKTWIMSGVAYLAIVIIGFTLITGENPLTSTDMNHDEHSEEHE